MKFFTDSLVISNPTPTSSSSEGGCPHCFADSSCCVPIRYGTPTVLTRLQAAIGELVLGDANFGLNEPLKACMACGTKFGRPLPNLDRYGRQKANTSTTSRVVEVLEPAALSQTIAVPDGTERRAA